MPLIRNQIFRKVREMQIQCPLSMQENISCKDICEITPPKHSIAKNDTGLITANLIEADLYIRNACDYISLGRY